MQKAKRLNEDYAGKNGAKVTTGSVPAQSHDRN